MTPLTPRTHWVRIYGLRGYQIGEFLGARPRAGGAYSNLCTAPLAILSQRFGGVAFYDIGHAAASYPDLVPRNHVVWACAG